MAGRELDVKDIEEIKRLKALGFSKRKIAVITGIHRATVTKYRTSSNPPTFSMVRIQLRVLACHQLMLV